ncbi:FecR family protein [Dawidia soli]|uniref:FecR domain-containing protein n=1 Tax=Dawidia soli TaxID=2782352 RepID=A0AAP2GFB3_9BACT|nr:FecR domain-containing protein [Dawidia soli]MBT1689239.1 FecR domain-containing protein [Dawidia soli]
MENISMEDLVRRFLDDTATPAERDRVYILLASGTADQVMGEELYREARYRIENPQATVAPPVPPMEARQAATARARVWDRMKAGRTLTDDVVDRFPENNTAAERDQVYSILAGGDPDDVRSGDEVIGAAFYREVMATLDNPPIQLLTPQEARRSARRRDRVWKNIMEPQPLPLNRSQGLMIAAAVAGLLLMASWLFNLWHSSPVYTPVIRTCDAGAEVYQDKQFLRLPDHSAVTLNNQTRLCYGPNFTQGYAREVVLEGEAYFDIAHDATRPFVIHTQGVTIQVLGTAFNVEAFTGRPSVVVTVARGRVRVSSDQYVHGEITAGQQLIVDTRTHRAMVTTIDPAYAQRWTDDMLVFDGITLDSVARLLEARFQTRITVAAGVKHCDVKAVFQDDQVNLQHILKTLQTLLPQLEQRTRQKGELELYGSGCE